LIRLRSQGSKEGGQVLVLFAGGVLALLIVAALAFDVGMMLLERRDQQNAADAASLAGARYVTGSANFNGVCPDVGITGNQAVDAACAIVRQNGFDHAADAAELVHVYIPAQHGRYASFPNFVEVEIDADRPSIFAGVIGQGSWAVGVFAVATDDQEVHMPFSMLALNMTECKAIKVSGSGVVEANGNIQSNSNGTDPVDCGGIGLSRTGGGTINITAPDATCRSAGDIQDQGSGTMTCVQAPDSFAIPDPLGDLDPPARPPLAAAMQPVGHSLPVPPYCPGSIAKPPTETTAQRTCDPGDRAPGQAPGDYVGKAWILSPGLYPNGIHSTKDVILYMLPGVYWIAGGGFQVTGGTSVISIKDVADANVNPAAATYSGNDCEMDPTTPATEACGVLIYNSEDTTVPFASGPISLGGNGGRLLISWLDVPPTDPYYSYYTMSIFQDRNVTETVTFNGSSAVASEVGGIVYVPSGALIINGSASTFTLDQVIADTFTVNGNGGTIKILKRVGVEGLLQAAGLVD
jgi:Putative Flp pilus-assembly TadE/G-like